MAGRRSRVSDVLRRLEVHWWPQLDEEANYVPLTKVDQLNALGEGPLHIAAWKGSTSDLEWILNQGADLTQRGDFGMTALHYAYMGGNMESVRLLLQRGADPDAKC